MACYKDIADKLNSQIKNNTQFCEDAVFDFEVRCLQQTLLEESYNQKSNEPYVAVEQIWLNQFEYFVLRNEMVRVHPTLIPQNATVKRLIYSSSDTRVFTVLQTGVIIGHESGTATLTVKSEDSPDVEVSAKVTVGEEFYRYTLGQLLNVSEEVDNAPDGSILVKNGNQYEVDNYTDIVVLNMDEDSSELWSKITNTYPSNYMITRSDLLDQYPAEIHKADSQIRILFTIGLRDYVINLIKVDNTIYKNIYCADYVE